MGKTNGTIALDKFQDNADPAVEVRDRGNHDMTAPIRGRQQGQRALWAKWAGAVSGYMGESFV
jgi:hypothetical protein